jgi:hypothetical protein
VPASAEPTTPSNDAASARTIVLPDFILIVFAPAMDLRFVTVGVDAKAVTKNGTRLQIVDE